MDASDAEPEEVAEHMMTHSDVIRQMIMVDLHDGRAAAVYQTKPAAARLNLHQPCIARGDAIMVVGLQKPRPYMLQQSLWCKLSPSNSYRHDGILKIQHGRSITRSSGMSGPFPLRIHLSAGICLPTVEAPAPLWRMCTQTWKPR